MAERDLALTSFNIARWQKGFRFTTAGKYIFSSNLKYLGYLQDATLRVIPVNTNGKPAIISEVHDFIIEENEESLVVLTSTGDVNLFKLVSEGDLIQFNRTLFSVHDDIARSSNIFINYNDDGLVMSHATQIQKFDFESDKVINLIDSSKYLSSEIIVDVKSRFSTFFILTNQNIYIINLGRNKDVNIVDKILISDVISNESSQPKSLIVNAEEDRILIEYSNGRCVIARKKDAVFKPNSAFGSSATCTTSYWNSILQENTNSNFYESDDISVDRSWDLNVLDFDGVIFADLVASLIYLWTRCDSQYKLRIIDESSCLQLSSFTFSSIIFAVKNGLPNIAVTEDYLIAVIHLPHQEMLVNKLMVYGSTNLADKLFNLNNWCHVKLPISFLEWGLRNHQLDMVSLFLSSLKLDECSESDFSAVMDLIFLIIKESVQDSRTFAEQLLQLILQYLISFLDRSARDDSKVELSLQDKIGEYILLLRKHLTFSSPHLPREFIAEVEDIQEVSIEEALKNRLIPVFQANLSKSQSTAGRPYDYIVDSAKKLVEELLREQDLPTARQVLDNLGIDWYQHFRSIRNSTFDRKLRNYLFEIDSDKPNNLVSVIQQIENYYPNHLLCWSNDSLIETPMDTEPLLQFEIPFIFDPCLECLYPDYSYSRPEESFSYSNLKVDWIAKMSEETVDLILCEGIRQSRANDFSNVNQSTLLKYILYHDDVELFPLILSENCFSEVENLTVLDLTLQIYKNEYFKNGLSAKFNTLEAELREFAFSSMALTNFTSFQSVFADYNLVNILLECADLFDGSNKFLRSPILNVVSSFLQWKFGDTDLVLDTIEKNNEFLNCQEIHLDENLQKFFFPSNKNKIIANSTHEFNTTANGFPVYDMLLDSASFSTKVFNWQNFSRNYFINTSSSDSFEIESPFASKYFCRHQVDLDFIHYLKQNRPCYAYAQFVLQEATRFNTCDKQRVKRASSLALNLALSNLTCQSLVASCVVFIELINMNSLRLRATSSVVSKMNWKQHFDSGGHLIDLVESFAESLTKDCSSNGDELVSGFIEKLQDWKGLIDFCELCSFDYPLNYPQYHCVNGNWLQMILTAQRCYYSPSQVLDLCNQLTDPAVSSHLKNSLSRIHFEQKRSANTLTSKRDIRATLYEKIGLIERAEPKSAESSSDATSYEEVDIPKQNVQIVVTDDLFLSLLQCGQNISNLLDHVSPSNPTLAIIASCYQDDSVWFYRWIDDVTEIPRDLAVTSKNSAFQSVFCSAWWSSVLNQGMSLFQLDSTLCVLFELMKLLFDDFNYEEFLVGMNEFVKSQGQPVSSRISDFISNISMGCSSLFKLHQFFQCLHDVNFNLLVSSGLAFGAVSKVQACLFTSSIRVPYAKWQENLISGSDIGLLFRCFVDELLSYKLQTEANSVQKILKVSPDTIAMFELTQLMEKVKSNKRWNNDARLRHLFWLHCIEKCRKFSINFDTAMDFFSLCIEIACSQSEKYFLIKSILRNWHSEISEDQRRKLEGNLWTTRIKVQNHYEYVDPDLQFFLSFRDINAAGFCHTLSTLKSTIGLLTSGNSDTNVSPTTVDEIVSYELDHDNLVDAIRVSSYFNHDSHHLELILKCMDLAEGLIQPSTIDYAKLNERALELTTRRRLRSSSLREVPIDQMTVVDGLEKLRDMCCHGVVYCGRIVTFYKAAMLLNVTYQFAANDSDVFDLVRLLLQTKTTEGISLAKQLFVDNCVSDQLIAQFVCDEVVSRLTSLVDSYYSVNSGTQITDIPDFSSIFTEFQELLRLVREPSLVGNQLLTESERVTSVVARAELYIWSHFCFSSACNTEGVAMILAKCRQLTESLDKGDYVLLVHLLTGIGRYSEMVYMFDLLKDSEQFELLLKKKEMDKLHALQIPLLDYLCRSHQSNIELFVMTAFHFCWYREIAEMLEIAADRQLEKFSNKEISGTQELDQALHHLREAAESYSMASCFSHANICCRRAQLVSLQIYLVPSGTRVVGLSPEQVAKFIESHSEFSEAYLISIAYQENANWSAALYRNVIIDGNMTYLNQFHNCIGVNEVLAEELCLRFSKDKSATEKMTNNLHRVVNLISDVVDRFKLTSSFLPMYSIPPTIESSVIHDYVTRGLLREQN